MLGHPSPARRGRRVGGWPRAMCDPPLRQRLQAWRLSSIVGVVATRRVDPASVAVCLSRRSEARVWGSVVGFRLLSSYPSSLSFGIEGRGSSLPLPVRVRIWSVGLSRNARVLLTRFGIAWRRVTSWCPALAVLSFGFRLHHSS
jgi:hypothetical protein